ncbi:tumor necrosis factor ligand superfamily member 10-like [Antechinus flavipes]|uniref:tumor necrosis factor ligand superfamily member 10-like n=1 Tax=Antechinus flavipes TaxID=38775 RepID=UPI0022361AE7|nr:tumor necrosis factor ligand superfamily member 10-like [Antechinus flavipes]
MGLPPPTQHYFRSDSSDSSACMMGTSDDAEVPRRRQGRSGSCSPVWLAAAAMAILALQVASTTGLFVYFTMSISKLKTQAQGIPEELKCLQLINSLQENPNLEELINNQTCLKLMGSIKSYVTSVTENVLLRRLQKGTATSVEGQALMPRPFSIGAQPSAHVTLIPYTASMDNLDHLGELPQSCRYPLHNWESQGLLSHLRNITFKAGTLRVSQGGKYYVYSQIYFRYPAEAEGNQLTSQQLVQCISRQTAYRQPILLLKGVATKCWSPEAEYGLHAIYQGGLFELKAGDELLVSVSSLAVDDTDGTSSYFGAFRLAM